MNTTKFSNQELIDFIINRDNTSREKLEREMMENINTTTELSDDIQIIVHPLNDSEYSSKIRKMYPDTDEPPSERNGNIRIIRVKDGEHESQKRWVINVSLDNGNISKKLKGVDIALDKFKKIRNLKGKSIVFPTPSHLKLSDEDYKVKVVKFAISQSQSNINFYDCGDGEIDDQSNISSQVSQEEDNEEINWSTTSLLEFTQQYTPLGWNSFFDNQKETIEEISDFLSEVNNPIYPELGDVYSVFECCPPEAIKVVILGQDPYHNPGQAMGMSFSVREGLNIPPSLQNIFKELILEGYPTNTKSGDLSLWVYQGILLINSALTVEKNNPGCHSGIWAYFTSSLIKYINKECDHVVWALWGNSAQRIEKFIDVKKHLILKSPHPSPFSANKGFFGNDHFRKINQQLWKWGYRAIDWSLNDKEIDCVDDAINLLSKDWVVDENTSDEVVDQIEIELTKAAQRLNDDLECRKWVDGE